MISSFVRIHIVYFIIFFSNSKIWYWCDRTRPTVFRLPFQIQILQDSITLLLLGSAKPFYTKFTLNYISKSLFGIFSTRFSFINNLVIGICIKLFEFQFIHSHNSSFLLRDNIPFDSMDNIPKNCKNWTYIHIISLFEEKNSLFVHINRIFIDETHLGSNLFHFLRTAESYQLVMNDKN